MRRHASVLYPCWVTDSLDGGRDASPQRESKRRSERDEDALFFYEQKFGWGSLTLLSATTSWSADVKTSVHTHTKKIENKIYLALQKEIGTVISHKLL